MATEQELRAAAERIVSTVPEWPSGLPEDGPFIVPAKVWGDALRLAAFIQRLTAPLPDDLEAELQAAVMRLVDRNATDHADTLRCRMDAERRVADSIRPLLQRAAGVRADGDHAIGIGDDEL